MVKRKRKKKNIIIFILISILIIGIIYFGILNIFYKPPIKQLFQITSRPCCNSDGQWISGFPAEPKYYNTVSKVKIKDIEYKFIHNNPTAGDFCGTHSDGTLMPSCCTKLEVFKNDVLIETIYKGLTHDRIGDNSDFSSYTCYSDGTCNEGPNFKPDLLSITITPLTLGWKNKYNVCQSIKNEFQLTFPNNSFELIIPNIEESYDKGENISLEIKVINNIGLSKANLKVNVLIDSIIGEVSKIYSLNNITLEEGITSIPLGIPSNFETKNIRITPEIEILYKIEGISGILFDDFNILEETEYLPIGSFIGNTSITAIVSENEKVYYRFENNNCVPVGLTESKVTDKDYTTLILCNKNIIIVPIINVTTNCTEGEYKTKNCLNGSIIQTHQCINGVWLDLESFCNETKPVTCTINSDCLKNQICENNKCIDKPVNYILYLVIISLIIIIIVIIYYFLRKK